jgi:hypothetical protein
LEWFHLQPTILQSGGEVSILHLLVADHNPVCMHRQVGIQDTQQTKRQSFAGKNTTIALPGRGLLAFAAWRGLSGWDG